MMSTIFSGYDIVIYHSYSHGVYKSWMWVRQCHFLPPMTGKNNHTTYKHGDDWGMVQMALFYSMFCWSFRHHSMLRWILRLLQVETNEERYHKGAKHELLSCWISNCFRNVDLCPVDVGENRIPPASLYHLRKKQRRANMMCTDVHPGYYRWIL